MPGGTGSKLPSKGHPVYPVVLLVVPVLPVAREREADLLARFENDVLLVGTSFVAVFGNALLHARADVVLGHLGLNLTSPLAQSISTSWSPWGIAMPASSQAASNACW